VLDRAITDLERARTAQPGRSAIVLSSALVMRADAADHAGDDPRPYLERARTVLEEAAEESPERVATLQEQRVRVETELAALACRSGVAPAEAFAPAVDAARALLRRGPESSALHHHLGTVFARQSDACTRHNADPAPARDAAVAAMRAALERDAAYLPAQASLGLLLASEGRAAAAAGRPFEAIFTEGDALLRAVQGVPLFAASARADRALLAHYWAEARWNAGGDALPVLAQARALVGEALHAQPGWTKWLLRAAEIELFVVRARHAQGQAATTQLTQAGEWIGRAQLTAVRERDGAALTAGRFHRLHGDDLALRDLDPMPAWSEAITTYSALLQRQPRWGEALLQRATCRLAAARYAHLTLKHTGLPLLDGAIADLDTYLGLWPGEAAVWANRGSAYASKGDALEAQGQDPVPWWNRALADLAKAGALSPRMWQVHANRGMLLEGMDRLEEALAAFEAALAANPKAPGVARQVSRYPARPCRRRSGARGE
jgi:tetratricopeptide (TPR) repeat protein